MMEEFPGEGTDVVEELEGGVGSIGVDGARAEEELEMSIDFFGRGVCDSEMVVPIPA
jgi:hypothetical protein